MVEDIRSDSSKSPLTIKEARATTLRRLGKGEVCSMVTQQAMWVDTRKRQTAAGIGFRDRLAVASLLSILLLGMLSCTTGPRAGGSGAVRYIQIHQDFTPS